jgi:alanyl-tRNA synthetase
LAQIGTIVGVKGGGPPHLARGGGAGDLTRFDDAIDQAKKWIEKQVL